MIVVVIALFGLISMEVWMWALFYYQIGFLKSFETALYFSTVTFSTIGYGDIVPMHPLARSLCNIESIVGQLYPATILARLVTLELDMRS